MAADPSQQGREGQQPSPYGQPPPPQPYSSPQPGQPLPKRRSKLVPWLVAGAVLLVLCCGGGAFALLVADGEDSPPADSRADRGDEPPADAPADRADAAGATGIGEPVRDGKFEFTVTDIQAGVEEVGEDIFGETAQGQFVLVHVTVENIGNEAQYFDGSSQALLDTEGREHSADTEAAIYIEDSESFLNEINPGNKVDGVVVFDIPPDAVPAKLRLHDSPFSGGAEVDVS
jgi:hypothetical protein